MPPSSTLDSAWLSTWIQPQHFDTDALAAHRRAFEAHPVRLGIVKSFLRDDRARQLSEFLLHEARFRASFGLYSQADGVLEAEWSAAAEPDRFYRMGIIDGVAGEHRLGENVLTYLRFMRALSDQRLIAIVEALTGFTLSEARTSVHAMSRGDYLLVHDDDVNERRVAFVLFLTPEWRANAGGILRLFGVDGQSWDVAPEYNSLAFFDVTTGTSHEVGIVTPEAGERARVTVSGWFLGRSPQA